MTLDARGIIAETSFATCRDALLEELGQTQCVWDDIRPSFDFVIARIPDTYPVIPGTDIHCVHTRAGVLPPLSIWYRADHQNVTFLHIEKYRNGEDDDSEA